MIKTRIVLTALLLGLTAWLVWALYQAGYFEREALVAWAEASGIWAPLIIIGAIALAAIAGPIPSMPIAVASGAIFGAVPGFLYSMTGGLLGAGVSFWLARLAGRPLLERMLSGRIGLFANCSKRMLFWMVLGSRLVPVFSFALVSYGAGLTVMGIGRFLLATGLGMMPMTAVFVAIGASLEVNPWLAGGGALAALLLLLLLPRLAEKYNLFGLSDYMRRNQQ